MKNDDFYENEALICWLAERKHYHQQQQIQINCCVYSWYQSDLFALLNKSIPSLIYYWKRGTDRVAPSESNGPLKHLITISMREKLIKSNANKHFFFHKLICLCRYIIFIHEALVINGTEGALLIIIIVEHYYVLHTLYSNMNSILCT